VLPLDAWHAHTVVTETKTIVVGGGISGLVCGYALRKTGDEAVLLEASARVGGVIRSERRDGFLLELGPQSFSGTAELRKLCAELGIREQVVEAPARAPRYVLVGGQLVAVPMSPPALLTSSLLGGRTKWNIARDAFGWSCAPDEDESIAGFVRRKFGAELLDRLVGPFVSGVYAGDPERLSLRSAFPQLYEAEKSAGSVIRGMMRAAKAHSGPRERGTLLSFCEGNETLVRALGTKIGASLQLNAEVVNIAIARDSAAGKFEVRVRAAGGDETILAERLVMATPTDVAGRLLSEANAELGRLLNGIEYAPVAVVSLGYRRADVGRSLDGFGFLAPRSSGLRVLGTVWNSSLFSARAPDGLVLLTSFVGGATDVGAVTLSDEALTALVHSEIRDLLQLKAAAAFSHVQIYRRALPQYNLGHAARLAAIERSRQAVGNLYFVGNYLRGPAIGSCVEQALAVAAAIHPV
jgi:protoporphyrinogen/coproporphyrinogen III oxidase